MTGDNDTKNPQEALFEQTLARETERLRVILRAVSEGVIVADTRGIITHMNPTAAELTGWPAEAALGQPLNIVFCALDEQRREPLPDSVARCLSDAQSIFREQGCLLIGRSGREYRIQSTALPVCDSQGRVSDVILVFRDVTQTRRSLLKAFRQPHAPLGTLVTRRELEQRLQHASHNAKEHGTSYVLCCLDLDQFKRVTETAGSMAGEELLSRLASLLNEQVRHRDTLARLTSDSLGLLLENCTLNKALEIAETLVATVRDFDFVWQDTTFKTGISIGLVSVTGSGDDATQLITQAKLAANTAKDLGSNQVYTYRLEDQEQARRHRSVIRAAGLLEALETDRLQLLCQPILPLSPQKGDSPLYFEILLRMLGANDELLLPEAFIPSAERHRLMATIDRWVIRASLSRYAELLGSTNAPAIGINLSQSSLDSELLKDFVQRQLMDFAIPPDRIVFEISERIAALNRRQARRLIDPLKLLGCRFAVNDFGNASISPVYLKELPIDYLKISCRFVRTLLHDPIDQAMIMNSKQLAQMKGIPAIAVCVEEPAIAERLSELGIDYGQGYALGRPRPLDTLGNPPGDRH